MFQCTFDNDSGEYALAKRQAEAYPGDDIESKVKGNLAEIAFQGLCRQILPLNKWHWHNGPEIRRGEREYNEHDFTVLGRTVDVKARSDVNSLFNIDPDQVDSDLAVLAWVPPEITEAVLEADSIISLGNVHPREHDPVTVIGWISQDKLNPPDTELPNPARGTTLTFRHFEVENILESPLGSNLTDWLSEEENAGFRRKSPAITADHLDKDGKRLNPGTLVKYKESDTIKKGLVVECPYTPLNCVFDPETRRYEGEYCIPDDPAVGVIELSQISDDCFERIHRLAWENLYPAIRGELPSDVDVNMKLSSSMESINSLTHLSHPIEKPTGQGW